MAFLLSERLDGRAGARFHFINCLTQDIWDEALGEASNKSEYGHRLPDKTRWVKKLKR